MGPARISAYDFTPRFQREYRRAPADIQRAAKKLFDDLMANPNSHRCHGLRGYKPTIFVADVLSNHSWQVTFEMDGEKAILRRLASHQEIDDLP